ncbi:response regulator [Sphingomonas sp. JC676]|uniref:response regulator n=1 Tax=Sphingomonas sp. JC676 TaxID=2768065 RepID=UPI001657F999|nr:response regulator [Sphingomonas sp. JC676]MBC9033689.1 response regulator [Sphingomonas sp. JC676]
MGELLSDHRVLVVEDEMMVLMSIENMLAELGCRSVTVAATVTDALSLIGSQIFDLAMLDLNLGGTRSYPVADALAARGVPFLFSTGYTEHGVCARYYPGRPVLNKPYPYRKLSAVLTTLLGEKPPVPA